MRGGNCRSTPFERMLCAKKKLIYEGEGGRGGGSRKAPGNQKGPITSIEDACTILFCLDYSIIT